MTNPVRPVMTWKEKNQKRRNQKVKRRKQPVTG
jgi:hypothetical protein